MKYCCDKFEAAGKLPSTTAPNIRIVKFKPIERFGEIIGYYAFYVTIGYQEFSLKLPVMMISFCPFCGTNLKKFYSTDDFANEFEGKTFPVT